jgi:DNA-binding transcriptional ArsR family regulator
MTNRHTPIDVMEVEDLRVLEAMNNPLRLKILSHLTEPRSVKEVAHALHLPPTRLYYHINALERFGVIRVVDTHKVGAIMEKVYQVVATHFRPGPGIAQGIEDYEWAAGVMAGTVLDGARLDAVSALSAHLANVSTGDPIDSLHGTLGRVIGSMTWDRADDFAKRVEDLAIEMSSGEYDDDEGDEYAFSFVFLRMSAPVRGIGS